jgi:hypothetical protein
MSRSARNESPARMNSTDSTDSHAIHDSALATSHPVAAATARPMRVTGGCFVWVGCGVGVYVGFSSFGSGEPSAACQPLKRKQEQPTADPRTEDERDVKPVEAIQAAARQKVGEACVLGGGGLGAVWVRFVWLLFRWLTAPSAHRRAGTHRGRRSHWSARRWDHCSSCSAVRPVEGGGGADASLKSQRPKREQRITTVRRSAAAAQNAPARRAPGSRRGAAGPTWPRMSPSKRDRP